MTETDGFEGYVIDREKLDTDYPTQFQSPELWQELGRTVAAFGFLEEMLSKAIFALTGAKEFDPAGDPEAFNAWIKTLEKALTDQLGGLIVRYESALSENQRTKGNDYTNQIAGLKSAKDIRHALCHGSWGKPDEAGLTVPKFVNRRLEVFETPIGIAFLRQTRSALRHMICDVLDSVTSVGYQFPGSESPGEQLWPHLGETVKAL
jgi:hypothetical protein